MKRSRFLNILKFAVLLLAQMPSWLKAEEITDLIGKTVTIQFRKGVWVECLSHPSYEGLKLVDVKDGKAVFLDSVGKFTSENGSSIRTPSNNRCSSRIFTFGTFEGSDSYTVSIDQISAIFDAGRRVWGDGAA